MEEEKKNVSKKIKLPPDMVLLLLDCLGQGSKLVHCI